MANVKEVSKARPRHDAKPAAHGYEFGGPLGVTGITIGLPLVCYLSNFLCNDISGCPVPSVLHPRSATLESLKKDTGWPENGLAGLASWKVTAWTLAFYLLSAILQPILPGTEVEGVKLKNGGKLKYKFNAFYSGLFVLTVAGAGTIAQGAEFPLWTFIWDNQLPIITANLGVAFASATFVYVRSFSVKAGNAELRELAEGGHTGNLIYDWFIGRELNPRITLPLIGVIDIKSFMELRPGMLLWLLLDLTAIARQYRAHGVVTDSIVLVTVFQALYILDAWWMEPAMLTTIDITTDGFGFMLAFGDLVWLPITYSIQTRYLAMHPVRLGAVGVAAVLAVCAAGYYVFRAANNEKNRFRTDPSDPRISHLQYIQTKSGSRLLVSGWWGVARHINYLSDWIMSWAWCLPTGVAGFVIRDGATVQDDDARGWGMAFTYFYLVYFAVLLIHREIRDEEKCAKKYGADWKEYKKRVPSRIVPGIY
ncbi:MAG: hypothetical protein M1825_001230 [Sarcosagium campestre]|nr:MAG: hypothetical protein M1825_001230 [Sarcosagium campestre]